jgi:hypothetical protein
MPIYQLENIPEEFVTPKHSTAHGLLIIRRSKSDCCDAKLVSLLAGLAIVNLHNTWRADWRVIITVLGWLVTIGGIIRIVVPQVAIAIGSTIYSGRGPTIVVALIVGALGAFLSFKGYVRRA